MFRGERKVWQQSTRKLAWKVDGMAVTDHGIKVYEYQGERFHSGCPKCHRFVDKKWQAKKNDILQLGYELEVFWSCGYKELLKKMKNIESSFLPRIFQPTASQNEIIDDIKNGKIFGFVLCDLTSSQVTVEKWNDFPPCLKRLTIENAHLTPEMKQQIIYEKKDVESFKRETLVQCFNAEKQVIITPLAQFYMSQGIVLKNITGFVQFSPFKSLNPFANHVTAMDFNY